MGDDGKNTELRIAKTGYVARIRPTNHVNGKKLPFPCLHFPLSKINTISALLGKHYMTAPADRKELYETQRRYWRLSEFCFAEARLRGAPGGRRGRGSDETEWKKEVEDETGKGIEPRRARRRRQRGERAACATGARPCLCTARRAWCGRGTAAGQRWRRATGRHCNACRRRRSWSLPPTPPEGSERASEGAFTRAHARLCVC